jgi:hypothetical protein
MNTKYNEQRIQDRVQKSIDEFYKHDSFLLKMDANERSITHKLAGYLENCFPRWDVDCEYNRDGREVKRQPSGTVISNEVKQPSAESVLSDDTTAVTVFPDIIIHKRGTKKNLLVIEVKKAKNNILPAQQKDLNKLSQFKRDPFNYCFAIFLVLGETGIEKPIGFEEPIHFE